MANKASKGASFEREICKKLSRWWSHDQHDDIFWRTSISGGRATARRKKSKKTFGQTSDVQATNPVGQPLIDLIALEVKCGYSDCSIVDWFDGKAKGGLWMGWLDKVGTEADFTEVPFWALIWKRKFKETTITFPMSLYEGFEDGAGPPPQKFPMVMMNFGQGSGWSHPVAIMRLDDWLDWVCPDMIRSFKRRRDGEAACQSP